MSFRSQSRPPSPPATVSTTVAPVQGWREPRRTGRVLWRFARPHTIIGTSLSVWGLWVLAWPLTAGLTLFTLIGYAVVAWLACLCGNVYIVGLNQLEDVAIDRINKPHLPLASGALTRSQARWIVGSMGIVALLIALSQGMWLTATVGISLLIGTAYSLPPLRLKRFPFWASVCILSVRGGIVNLGLFCHYQQVFSQAGLNQPGFGQNGLIPAIPGYIWALTGFVIVFSIAIAIFKDIPDLEGDRQYGIQTFTVRLGQRRVFQIALGLLTACYVGMIMISLGLSDLNPAIMVGGHGLALATSWYYSRRVILATSPAAHTTTQLTYPQFYQLIWKLFFLEYLLVPLAYIWPS